MASPTLALPGFVTRQGQTLPGSTNTRKRHSPRSNLNLNQIKLISIKSAYFLSNFYVPNDDPRGGRTEFADSGLGLGRTEFAVVKEGGEGVQLLHVDVGGVDVQRVEVRYVVSAHLSSPTKERVKKNVASAH